MADAPSPSTADAGSSSTTEPDPSATAFSKTKPIFGQTLWRRTLPPPRPRIVRRAILSHNQNLCVLVFGQTLRRRRRRSLVAPLCRFAKFNFGALHGAFVGSRRAQFIRRGAIDYIGRRSPLGRHTGGLHSCVSLSTIAAFKTRFWQQALLPTRLHGITHLFLVDSDMDIRPAHFDFVTLVRLSQATNVSILSPAPYGGGNGFYHLDAPRLNNNYALTKAHCGGKPSDWAYNCPVCRQSVVEVKAPLFTIAAWSVLFQRVLSRMPASTLVGTPEWIDLMWCQLMAHHLDGCDPSKQMGLPFGSDNCIGRNSCAYSYITPIKHNNDLEIEQRNRSRATGADPTRFTEVWLDKNAEKKRYFMAPSWRPKGRI